MDEMLELRQEFFSEAFELLSNMEEEILELEKDPESSESINAIFRVAHTIKGGAASLEMERITVFTHNLENLLDLVRDGKIPVEEDLVDILLKSLDIMGELLKAAAEQREAHEGIEIQTLNLIKEKMKSPGTNSKAAESPDHSISSPNTKEVVEPEILSEDTLLDIGDENFKDILLDEFSIGDEEKAQIKEQLGSGYHLYLLHVRLDDANEMKSVSGIQTITAIRGLGILVSAAPSVPEIMETEFIEHLQFLLLSKEGQDKIFGKIYLSDVTKEVEVSDISSMFGTITEQGNDDIDELSEGDLQNPLDIIPEQDFEAMHSSIEDALRDGFFVYNIRTLINKDAMMRSVDSLLVITSLEEIGDVIHAIPSKKELQGDEYYPVVDIILQTKESKELVKEKASISGTTLEIRVSEFRLKDSASSPSSFTREESTWKEDAPVAVRPSTTPISAPPVQDTKSVALSPASTTAQLPEEKITTSSPMSLPVKSPVDSWSSDPILNRLTSKEEARIRGIKSSDIGVAQKAFLKVESTRVDRLLNLVSELVISKAALTELSSIYISEISELKMAMSDTQDLIVDMAGKTPGSDHENLKKLSQYLLGVMRSWRGVDVFETTINRVSRSINELQEGITQIRMVPIGNVFNRFPRMIRDISRQLGKKIKLEIFGEDTELDKSVIEELSDPLMHMIRNSADHGVESPSERKAKGKPEEGTIILKAVHEGTTIRIEIIDDGKGLDGKKILKKAVEKGLVSPGQNLTAEEINHLILLPGFSTADTVTDLSGRGVGMDVVRRNIEELSGKLSIESEFEKGSKFIIKIPLTLSIIQALVFRVKGFSYAIPLSVISETVPLKDEDTKLFEKSEVISLGGSLISVINIAKVFNIKETRDERRQQILGDNDDSLINTDLLDESLRILDRIKFRDSDGQEEDYFSLESLEQAQQDSIREEQGNKYLIVVQTGSKKVGLLVDSIVSEQDIVIKPLDKRYSSSQGLSGATILGDGSISLIIDVAQIVDLYLRKDNVITV